MTPLDLSPYGISGPQVVRNATAARLYEEALERDAGSAIATSGALIASSGEKTGRSPGDKRLISDAGSDDDVWWGSVNMAMDDATFTIARAEAVNYLSTRERLYVVDGFAGWDPRYRVRIRVICERPYHALFMRNMLIRPNAEELAAFGDPDHVIINAGRLPANDQLPGIDSGTHVSLNLQRGELLILGTEYAGEMKKGVFTLMNYLMPKQGILSMHCSANEGPQGDVSVFFGLSGTGKTTLSADPRRRLIGDDEHCWTEQGVFNIEGGCYAKVIDLSPEAEPDIHAAIRFGAVLENVAFERASGEVDFGDGSITENTRCAYPVNHIANAKIPGTGAIPRNVIFLTCDAFSVLPPVSRLSPEQAMYHFISGYTAKVAGTEMGVTEPQATFSACFGAPFLVWHPTVYAELLAEKIREHEVDVWLVNTGWSGGPCGVGERMSIAYTRAIIDAIHDGSLAEAPVRVDPVFGFQVPRECAGVPDEILDPASTWPDVAAYREAAAELARRFQENFAAYADQASAEIRAAAPAVPMPDTAERAGSGSGA
ncbi:phosphoenolpyruvate carboxykinase (ATP) [Sediminicurvatus halobius]|uniref:Phosphoenolpyruvate carboxykinase (ATP) n=1 Tax=Sediminicurvatus halobius TaxID=2182432 RepID=A0A2U2N8E9_9GAMM|nr:phosphoenolpyruvate carboxykinase (ATP) [Spiribacter halobius]PWG65461.1 phosphoenolpyruvate carboxykinase (ATP) [Spiribacter halobius]UEX76483.1 phosphoenolpyruvate carboxykinase (ATP) [Spiribacter halobius]